MASGRTAWRSAVGEPNGEPTASVAAGASWLFVVGCRPVGPPRKLNLRCLPCSTTYLTQMEEHEFALHLKNASGYGPC